MDQPKLNLSGVDGNAYALLAAARKSWLRGGGSPAQWLDIKEQATSGSYDHLIGVLMEHFDVEF